MRDSGGAGERGEAPIYPGTSHTHCHEPHVVELASGQLVGMIRLENAGADDVTKAGLVHLA